jgi:hypothetical protein
MFYNFPGAPGNTGYQAQANPNPLTDPRFRIQGGEPWGNRPILPGEKETLDKPFTPLLPPGQNVPLAQGLPGNMGNVGNPRLQFTSLSGPPMGNVGFFARSQYGQQMPAGFQSKMVS